MLTARARQYSTDNSGPRAVGEETAVPSSIEQAGDEIKPESQTPTEGNLASEENAAPSSISQGSGEVKPESQTLTEANLSSEENAVDSSIKQGGDEAKPESQTATGVNVASEDNVVDSAPAQKRDATKRPLRTQRSRDHDNQSLLEIAMAGTNRKVRDERIGSSISRKAVEMELNWLADPKDLQARVARLLTAGDVAFAAELVRTAQIKRLECGVAWNRLLSYCMEKGNALAAFKFYNDVSLPEFLLVFSTTILAVPLRNGVYLRRPC